MFDENKNNNIIDQMLGDLTSFTERTFETDKFGHKWVFKAIGSGDHVNVIADSYGPQDRVARLFKLEIVTLRRALLSVDGVVLNDQEKEYLFDHVAPTVIDELADAYEAFRANNEKELKASVGTKPAEPTTEAAPPVQAPAKRSRRAASADELPRSVDEMPSVGSVVPPSRG